MKKVNVLVVGKNEAIVELLIRLVNKYPELSAQGTCNLEEIESLCLSSSTIELIILSSGLSTTQEMDIKNIVSKIHPKVKCLEHFGGGSGLLRTEIIQALGYLVACPE